VDELLAYTLTARNLAIAEKTGLTDFVAPCSACFKNAYFTNANLKHDPDLAEHINFALEEDHLHVEGKLNVRHLIEVFIEDVGLQDIQRRVTHPLTGLRVAPYYGCQLLRPRKAHEDVENPRYFEELLSAMDAEPVEYASKTRCCGASLIITNRKAALEMVRILLENAIKSGAHVIATTCPMCHVNLEVYQSQVNQEFGTNLSIPVIYFTQLMGVALGLNIKNLAIEKAVVAKTPMLA
jgi:heterodisulfide reductase subunit B